jgi:tetratricopeptide (TPR) repeat protein
MLLYRISQTEPALVYLQDSHRHFMVLNDGGRNPDIATVTHNISRVRFDQQEFEAALVDFERALAFRRRHSETSVVDLSASLCSVGSTLEKLGREDEAVEFYAELVDLDCLAGNAVDFTLVCSALANIYKRQGNVDDARQLYEKAARVGRSCLGETHPVVAGSLKELADCHLKNGDAAQAIENYKAALELEQLASEKTHDKTVKVLYSIALLYQKVGQYAAALEKFTMVYELQKKKYGAGHKASEKPRVSMAEMEYQLKNYERAFEIYQGILRMKQESGEDDVSGCSCLMNSLGIVSFAKADYVAASRYFQSCLDTRSTWSADSASVLYNLATAEEKLGRHERAIECFEKSLAMDEMTANATTAAKYENSNVILDTLQRLGRMYQLSGDLCRALVCARKALQRLENSVDAGSLLVRAKLQNLSGNLHLQLGNVGNMMESYTKAIELFRAAGHENDEAIIIAGFYLYGFSKLHPPCAEMA